MGGGEGDPPSGGLVQGDRLAACDSSCRQQHLERGCCHRGSHAREVSEQSYERGGGDAEVTREAAEGERAGPVEGDDLPPAGKGGGPQVPVVVAALAGPAVGDRGRRWVSMGPMLASLL